MRLGITCLVGSVLGCSAFLMIDGAESRAATVQQPTTLFLTHSSHGNLTSCGCGNNTFGGETGKLATLGFLASEGHEKVLSLEGGAFALGGKGALDIALGRAYKGLFMAQKVEVVCCGPAEVVGRLAMRSAGLSMVCGNWVGPSEELRRWGTSGDFQVTSLVSPALVDQQSAGLLEDPVETAIAWTSEAAEWGRLPVVFLHVTRLEANKIIKAIELSKMPAILVDASDGPMTPGVTVDSHLIVVRIEENAKHAAQIRLSNVAGGKSFSTAATNRPGEMRVMEATVMTLLAGSKAAGKKVLSEYDREIATHSDCTAAYDGFVGSAACKNCHAERFKVWAATKHSESMLPLVQMEKSENAGCYSCHVTADRTRCEDSLPVQAPEHLRNVGCEACHGPGQAHVNGAGAMRRVADGNTCLTCHIGRFGGLDPDAWKSICRGK